MDRRARSLSLLLGFGLGGLVGFAVAWLVLPVGTPAPAPPPAVAAVPMAARPPAPAPALRAEPPAASPRVVDRAPSPPPPTPPSEAPAAAAPSDRVPPLPGEPAPAVESAVEPVRVAPPPAEELPDDDGVHPGEEYVWASDRHGIRSAVRASIPAVRQCYAAWLEANPALGGRIVVRFTIAPSTPGDEGARVQGAEVVESNMDHPLMESCVTAVLSTLTFEVPEDGILTVTYPFGMAPAAPAERGAP
jgi:hypothetical protein